jgi:hypothetical protein
MLEFPGSLHSCDVVVTYEIYKRHRRQYGPDFDVRHCKDFRRVQASECTWFDAGEQKSLKRSGVAVSVGVLLVSKRFL